MTRKIEKIDEFKTYTAACGCPVIAHSVRHRLTSGGKSCEISQVAADTPAMVEEAFRRLEGR